jgi:uracil-DNA glycosylase
MTEPLGGPSADPRLIVALGATAYAALFGPSFRVTQERGRIFDTGAGPSRLATVHPSSILFPRDEAARNAELQQLIADLRVAARSLRGFSGGKPA